MTTGTARPQVAVVCSPGGSAALRPLAAALARRTDLRSLGRADRPVALLASDRAALDRARRSGRGAAVAAGASVEDGHLVVFGDGIEGRRLPLPSAPRVSTSTLPPLAPHVRRRWRRRLGLADDLVVDTAALDPLDVPTALAVAAAAVVDARHLPAALALGCPVVTDASSARRVGAVDGQEVVVGNRDDAAALAADDRRASGLSRRAHDLAVTRFDPSTTASRLLDLWGLADETPKGRVEAALADLGTAPGAAPRRRVADALVLFAPPGER